MTRNGSASGVFAQTRYGYDGNGRLAGLTSSTSGYCTPTSDDFGSQCAGVVSPTIRYDGAGNVDSADLGAGMMRAGGVSAGNRLTRWAADSLAYDADGNLVAKNGATLYAWTADQRLDCAGQGYCYRYNAAGRPVLRTLNGANDRWYLWDGDQLLAELDATATQRIAEYIYWPGVDRPHAIVTGATTIQATRYFEQDALGNVVGLHGPGDVVAAQLSYDAWGQRTGATGGLADTNLLQWKGLLWQEPAGLYYARARWYDPKLGRFLSEDPLGLADGTNLYTFARGDPLNASDPSGTCTAYDYTRGKHTGEHEVGDQGQIDDFRDGQTHTCCGDAWVSGTECPKSDGNDAKGPPPAGGRGPTKAQRQMAKSPQPYPSCSAIHYDGTHGYIAVQTDPNSGTVAWGAYMYPGVEQFGSWRAEVFINGKRAPGDGLKEQDYPPHSSINPSDVKSGDLIQIQATFVDLIGLTYTSVPNGCIVP